MPDSKSKWGSQDGSRIDLSQAHKVRYWGDKFDLPPRQLSAAVEKVGIFADTVDPELERG